MGVGRRLAGLLVAALLSGCVAAEPAPPPSALEQLHEDLTAFWDGALEDGVLEPELVVADGEVESACGAATEDEGSFFCGADSTVYLQESDLEFLPEQAWPTFLLAHEYGHAVQDQLGVDDGDAGPGPDGDSVRYELQADCLAGAYVATVGEAAAYLEVVEASGDDAGDPLPEEEYEHGSSAQRLEAFVRGHDGGPQACDLGTGAL